MQIKESVAPENIHTPATEGLFYLNCVHPSENSSLASYFPLKILAFETPFPLGISNDVPWGEYGYFLELHNKT